MNRETETAIRQLTRSMHGVWRGAGRMANVDREAKSTIAKTKDADQLDLSSTGTKYQPASWMLVNGSYSMTAKAKFKNSIV